MKILVLKCAIFSFLCLATTISAQNAAETPSTTKTEAKKKTNHKKKSTTAKKSGATAAVKPNSSSTTQATPAKTALNMPVMTFNTKVKDFGQIKTGDKPSFTYEFTNTGDVDLEIDMASGCDCTDIDWTRTVVKPGEKGFVSATFNSPKAEPEDHKKPLKKTVDVILKQKHPKTGYVIVETLIFNVFIID